MWEKLWGRERQSCRQEDTRRMAMHWCRSGEGDGRTDWKCVVEVEPSELANGLDVVASGKRRT